MSSSPGTLPSGKNRQKLDHTKRPLQRVTATSSHLSLYTEAILGLHKVSPSESCYCIPPPSPHGASITWTVQSVPFRELLLHPTTIPTRSIHNWTAQSVPFREMLLHPTTIPTRSIHNWTVQSVPFRQSYCYIPPPSPHGASVTGLYKAYLSDKVYCSDSVTATSYRLPHMQSP